MEKRVEKQQLLFREMGGRGRYMNMGGWKCKSTMDGSFKMVRRHERSWDGG